MAAVRTVLTMMILALFRAALAVQVAPAESPSDNSVDMKVCTHDFYGFTTYLKRAFGSRQATRDDLQREPSGNGHGRLSLILSVAPSGEVVLSQGWQPHGTRYKLLALRRLLQGVISRNQARLREELEAVGGNITMYWRFMNGDCPESRKWTGLPLHGWSSDPGHADIALPDFTFEEYKDIHSTEVNPDWRTNSWKDVTERLHKIPKTKRGFVWRGSYSHSSRRKLAEMLAKGPPESLKPLLAEAAPDGFNVSLMEWEHGSNVSRRDFMSLYDQCQWTYSFHVAGRHYSAMLKYKLACNQTVFMIARQNKPKEEFWYDALKHGKNIYFVHEDLSNLWRVIEKAFNTSDGESAIAKADEVAKAGRETADWYLSQRGIDCYVMMYLTNYYFPFWKKALETPGDATSSFKEDTDSKVCTTRRFGECDCEEDPGRVALNAQ